MKFDTLDNTRNGAMFTNILALFSFLASVLASTLASPILNTREVNSIASKSDCILGACGLGDQCFKANSCFGVNLFNPDWSHCKICACAGQAFGGRVDPKCVIDTECLNVQLGNHPDPCAQKVRSEEAPEIESREASSNSQLLRSDIDEYPGFKEFHSDLPQGSVIDPDDMKRIGESLPPSHIVDERSELMDEFARFIDDGPGGPIIPDAAMMERLRPISHPAKRGGCYTFENGVVVQKRGGCGTVNNDIDIDADANIHKRGGCYTVENGVVVDKRGGCSTVETNTDVDADTDAEVNVDLDNRGGCYTIENGVRVEKLGGCGSVDLEVEAGVEKRVGCVVQENGIVYARPDCNDPNRGTGPPFPGAEEARV
ncbi:hypothetical protein V491_05873 [Pseudogymnoascus sp. VKM F-3775]|nr:hypothetical protein V491_05873 [Pseudogymnoascus sp. VKM F-3775]